MNKTLVPLSVKLFLFAPSIPLLTSCNNSENARPNILFIMSDDHTSQAFGIYNSRLAPLNPTPNLDMLAGEGIIFNNVYCNNSISTPSRASIITGQYPQTNGVLDLDGSLPPDKQYLPMEIRNLGYLTALIGKWHLTEEPSAFDYYNVLPGQGRYFDPVTQESGKGNWPDNRVEHKGHSSDVITDLSLRWLKNRDKTKPFFLMHHFKAPHDLFQNAERYNEYLANVTIPEPESLFKDQGHGSVSTKGYNNALINIVGASVSKRCNAWGLGGRLGISDSLVESEYTHEVYQAFLKRYLRCVKGIDDNIKRIIDYLKEEGIYDNTIIIYTSDQGYFLGEHDYFDKRWMYDESMRMPFIMRYPPLIKGKSASDLLINNTDFAPTLIELAGGTFPSYMQGKSFKRTIEGKKEKKWREATYYRYWMHMAHYLGTPAHFGIRTTRYKLIFFYGVDSENPPRTDYWGSQANIETPAGWEFYDLTKDPLEMQNRYNDMEYARIIKNLKKELKSVREELNETDVKYPHIQTIIDQYWDR